MTFSSDEEAHAFMEWLRGIPKPPTGEHPGDPPITKKEARVFYELWKKYPVLRGKFA